MATIQVDRPASGAAVRVPRVLVILVATKAEVSRAVVQKMSNAVPQLATQRPALRSAAPAAHVRLS